MQERVSSQSESSGMSITPSQNRKRKNPDRAVSKKTQKKPRNEKNKSRVSQTTASASATSSASETNSEVRQQFFVAVHTTQYSKKYQYLLIFEFKLISVCVWYVSKEICHER